MTNTQRALNADAAMVDLAREHTSMRASRNRWRRLAITGWITSAALGSILMGILK